MTGCFKPPLKPAVCNTYLVNTINNTSLITHVYFSVMAFLTLQIEIEFGVMGERWGGEVDWYNVTIKTYLIFDFCFAFFIRFGLILLLFFVWFASFLSTNQPRWQGDLELAYRQKSCLYWCFCFCWCRLNVCHIICVEVFHFWHLTICADIVGTHTYEMYNGRLLYFQSYDYREYILFN